MCEAGNSLAWAEPNVSARRKVYQQHQCCWLWTECDPTVVNWTSLVCVNPLWYQEYPPSCVIHCDKHLRRTGLKVEVVMSTHAFSSRSTLALRWGRIQWWQKRLKGDGHLTTATRHMGIWEGARTGRPFKGKPSSGPLPSDKPCLLQFHPLPEGCSDFEPLSWSHHPLSQIPEDPPDFENPLIDKARCVAS